MDGAEPIFDPYELTAAQRLGGACVVCAKVWPRPDQRVGGLPGGSPVYACDDCAPGVRAAIEEAAGPEINSRRCASTDTATPRTPRSSSCRDRLRMTSSATGRT